MADDTTKGDVGGGSTGGDVTLPLVLEPAKSGETQQIDRNPDGTFKKGVSGNPAGPKPGYKHLTTLLTDFLKQKHHSGETYDRLLIQRVAKKAIEEGSERMIEHIWDRMEGKPKQSMDLHVQEELTPEQRAKLNQMLGLEPDPLPAPEIKEVAPPAIEKKDEQTIEPNPGSI